MIKLVSAIIFILALTIFPVPSNAQLAGFGNGFLNYNITGGGARAAGMGDAFIALAEGEMAYSWNPAAMVYTDATKFGLDFLSKSDKITRPYFNFRGFDLRNPLVEQYQTDLSHTSLNYGGFSAPFSLDSDSDARLAMIPLLPLVLIPITFSPSEDLELSIGGGYRHIYDLKASASFPGFDNSKNTFDQGRGVDAVSLGIATKVTEGIGFGWNMNAYVRGSEYNWITGETENISEFFTDNRADTIVAGLRKQKSDFSGFNMDIGLSANYSLIRAGAILHTPYKLYQKSLLYEEIIIPPNPVGNVNRVAYTYDMPMSASFGLAVQPMENIAVAFDYVYRPLSKAKISVDWEQTALSIYDTTQSAEWEDVNQYRVGAEYTLDANFAKIPLRIGMRSEPLVIKEATEVVYTTVLTDSVIYYSARPEYGSQISTSIYSFGTGLAFERIWFDIAYQFGSYSYNTSTVYRHQDVTTDPNAPVETLYDDAGEVKLDYSRLFFSVGMYF